jgi:hypothetical protein
MIMLAICGVKGAFGIPSSKSEPLPNRSSYVVFYIHNVQYGVQLKM